MASVIDIITGTAARHGLDRDLALACAYQESKLNPRAVGDGGTSFGLYQLHIGGQLGNHSKEWAFNPANNAEQSLSTMAQVARQHPTWSPGEIAAASQRPANQTQYASNVNTWYKKIKTGQLDLGNLPPAPPTPGGDQAGWDFSNPLSSLGAWLLGPLVGGDDQGDTSRDDGFLGAASTAIGGLINFISLPHLGMRILCGVLGALALIGGIWKFTSEGDQS